MSEVRCVWNAARSLGEGPVWHEEEGALYWVDIDQPAVLRLHAATGKTEVFAMPERIGCIAIRKSGGWIAGMQSGFAHIDLAPLRVTPLVDPESSLPGNRFNDGKCDARGRFWAGTMDIEMQVSTGTLYRLDPDGSVHAMDRGYGVTNGPAWSPDGSVLYHNDSKARCVYAFDCDADAGTIHNKRCFAELNEAEGCPDGLTVDRDGYIWLAHWGGSRVTRFAPDGQIDRVVPMPVSQVTSCAFGGPELRTLYITSARIGLDAATLAIEPLAGGLFAIDVDITGLPANRFAG